MSGDLQHAEHVVLRKGARVYAPCFGGPTPPEAATQIPAYTSVNFWRCPPQKNSPKPVLGSLSQQSPPYGDVVVRKDSVAHLPDQAR